MYNRLAIRDDLLAALKAITAQPLAGWDFVEGLEGVQVSQQPTDKKVYVQITGSEQEYDDSRSEDWTVRNEIPERGIIVHDMTFFAVTDSRAALEEFVVAFKSAMETMTLGEKPNRVFFRVGAISSSHKQESNDELRNVLVEVQAAQQTST